MQTITLEVNSKEDAAIILSLAKRLECRIKTDGINFDTNSDEIIEIMKKIADRGTFAQAIPDPVAWQKEIRKDRPLPGRL